MPASTGRSHVEIDPNYHRPAEVDELLGEPGQGRTGLGLDRRRRGSQELAGLMVDADVALLDDQLSGRLVSQDRDG